MTISKALSDRTFIFSFWAIIAAITAFWFSYTYPQALNENMGVLLVFAERFLQGGTFGVDIYEVNPPLSTLIYAPVIWIRNIFNIDIHAASFIYISLYLTFSVSLVALLLKNRTQNRPYEHAVIIGAYILSQLFITVNDYGEREQLVSLGLTPLCILIYLKTCRVKLNKYLTFTVATLGIISILLKPHFGLAPAILFLHRAYKKKSLLAPIKDLDFIVMSLGTILYAIALVTIFKIYTFELLPDIFAIYVTNVLNMNILRIIPLVLSMLTLVMMGLAWSGKPPKYSRELLYLFGSLTCLSLLSFIAQAKGLFYQVIPSASLFILTISLFLFHTLAPYINGKRAALVGLLLPVVAAVIALYPLNFIFPDKDKIRELPFAQWFKTYCPEDRECSAYIFHEAVDGIFSSFLYTDTKFASRFAAQWFYPTTLSALERANRGLPEARVPLETAREINQKFGRYVGEDFQKFKPDFVALIHTQYSIDMTNHEAEMIDFNFIKHYSQFDLFKDEWKNYEYVGTEIVNRRHYFKGTGLDYDHLMTYDLYTRKQTK